MPDNYNPRGNTELESLVSQRALFNLLEDISEVRDELARAKEYVTNIIRSMLDALIVIEPAGTIIMVNDATCKLLGYAERDIVGKGIGLVFDEERGSFKETIMEIVVREGCVKDYNAVYKTNLGGKVPVSLFASIIKDKKNEIVGVVCIARDMRQFIDFMNKEKELATTLAVAEAERKKAEELEDAYRKLKEAQTMLIQAEKMQAMGQLASGVAHEVRNPLAIVIQGVDYLEKKILPGKKKKGKGDIVKVLSMVRRSIDRADKIIDLLFDFSKSTRLDLQPQDIGTIINNSLILARTKLRAADAEIVKEVKRDLPRVLVDMNKMEQVFVNLLFNAIRAMPKGGRIIIRSYDKKLDEVRNGVGNRKGDNFRCGEKAVIVEIEDTGVGIPEENMKKIFDPFFTTSGPKEGAGLGLSITRNIIDMHRGLISIESQAGKGTKVTVILKTAKEGGV